MSNGPGGPEKGDAQKPKPRGHNAYIKFLTSTQRDVPAQLLRSRRARRALRSR